MYLKSLEIHGFKSFPNRTVLTFEPGTTVVVGPNGSGKSNIADAMRWVLGEVSSKNIRGNSMEDVIFSGTDTRRQMGYAEVSVTFDNTDPVYRFDVPYDEVTVTRRYYRGGASDYLINQKPCLRKEVHELFYNTGIGRDGYSIIGQGKVAELISKKSEDRRNVFEEAAGIAKFRHSKHEAELNLANVQRNMETTNVQIQFYEEQLEPLEHDAEKAKRGMAILEEKKEVDVSLWLYDTAKIHQDLETAKINYKNYKEDYEVLEATIQKLYEERSQLELARAQSQYDSESLLDEINEVKDAISNNLAKQSEINANIKNIASQIEYLEESLKAATTSIASIRENITEYENTIHSYYSEIDNITDLKESEEASIAKNNQAIEELQAKINTSVEYINKLQNQSNDLRVQIDINQQNIDTQEIKEDEATIKLRENKELLAQLQSEYDALSIKVESTQKCIEEENKQKNSLNESIELTSKEKENLNNQLVNLKVQHHSKETRVKDLQRLIDNMEGYSRSVRVITNDYSAGKIPNAGKIYGPLSTLITIPKEYTTAIEIALGNTYQSIVTDNEQTAKAAIEYLKKTQTGRATFYPVQSMHSVSETEEMKSAMKMPGFISTADKLVSCDKTFKEIVEYTLLRTLIFDNIDHAIVASNKVNGRVKIVTLDGQVMNVGGSMTGGFVNNEGTSAVSRTSEVQTLTNEASHLEKEIDDLNEKIGQYDNLIQSNKQLLAQTNDHLNSLYSTIREQLNNVDRLKNSIDNTTTFVKNLANEIAESNATQTKEELSVHKMSLDQVKEEIHNQEDYQNDINSKINQLESENESHQEQSNNYSVTIAERNADIEGIKKVISTIQSQLNESIEGSNKIGKDLLEEKALLDSLTQDYDSITSTLEDNKTKLEQLNSQRTKKQSSTTNFDQNMSRISEDLKVKENDRNNQSRVVAEAESLYNALTEKQSILSTQLLDDYGMSYDDAVAANYQPITQENEKEKRALAISCSNRLKNVGAFDPSSIQKYAEMKASYDLVNDQFVDLKKSYDNLMQIISKLDEEMSSTFVESFEKINENFGVVFRELFGGGTAELSLSDPNDVLNSGIEIKAAPPGKKISNLSLLSGGEQAFISIALFFSILKLHPTPFCILDEVEAALDEVNVYRFGEYIKRFCSDTQFICISHRRGTMQIADRLYGVTMPERGITKVISVPLAEMDAKSAELTEKEGE